MRGYQKQWHVKAELLTGDPFDGLRGSVLSSELSSFHLSVVDCHLRQRIKTDVDLCYIDEFRRERQRAWL